jgi:hypothetical protein
MSCQRCRGLLVLETFGDLREEIARISPAMRCINCGCIEDAVVQSNRHASLVGKRPATRGMVRKGDVLFIKRHSVEQRYVSHS